MKKVLSVFFVLVLFISSLPLLGTLAADEIFKGQGRTRSEIIGMSKRLSVIDSGESAFLETPSTTVPYKAGKLSEKTIENGLNRLNFVRYLAGLNYDVTVTDEQNEMMQASSLVNAVNGDMTHFPSQPSGMDDAMYDLGYSGSSSGNIYCLYSSYSFPVTDGFILNSLSAWVGDSNSSNISALGHRRWILDPKMKTTGFGIVQSSKPFRYNNNSYYYQTHAGMQAFSSDRSNETRDVVMWPSAGYFPIEMYNSKNDKDAFSISLNSEKYDKTRTENIKVTVTGQTGTKETLSPKSGKFFVNTDAYGMDFCIIFLPGMEILSGGEYHIKVEGLVAKNNSGVSSVLEYDTKFFSLSDEITPAPDIIRLGGNDRIETSVKIADYGWESSKTVILATGYNYADALCGVPLAAAYDSPIILIDGKPGSLDSASISKINELNAENIIILGGTSAVSKGIENELKIRNINVSRIGGEDRFETCVLVAEALKSKTGYSDGAVITTGYNYADALSAGPYAGLKNYPILYVDPKSPLNENVRQSLNRVETVFAIGGTSVVTASVVSEIQALGGTVERISGEDRYLTSAEIYNRFKDELSGYIMLSTGTNFPDALSGGALAAKNKMPIILTERSVIREEARSIIKSAKQDKIFILGGASVISDNSVKNIFS